MWSSWALGLGPLLALVDCARSYRAESPAAAKPARFEFRFSMPLLALCALPRGRRAKLRAPEGLANGGGPWRSEP
ncbi:MAG TPA: hypothetical protein VJN18_29545 [Polyangiaceae bacterium]|nr:hypothetical protein [Polyangiaceae bacterium]